MAHWDVFHADRLELERGLDTAAIRHALECADLRDDDLVRPAGTTVTWINHDETPHTVVAAGDPRAFRSGGLDTDDKFSVTFTKPGIYSYLCTVHPYMTGKVVVK